MMQAAYLRAGYTTEVSALLFFSRDSSALASPPPSAAATASATADAEALGSFSLRSSPLPLRSGFFLLLRRRCLAPEPGVLGEDTTLGAGAWAASASAG